MTQPTGAESPTERPDAPRTLDDAASLLIQLEPDDQEGLRRAHVALANAAPADAATAAALAEVAHHLERGIGAPGSVVDEALELAAQVLEAAMSVRDAPLRSEPGVERTETSRDPVATSNPEMDEQHGAPETLPEDTDLDLLRDFIAESRDYLEGAEAALLALESDPGDSEAVNTVFRAFHTIKGTSAFLGLTHVTDFAHHAETLLTQVRDRTIPFTRGCADLALRSADMLKSLLAVVEQTAPGAVLVAPPGYEELTRAVVNVEALLDSADTGAGESSPPILAAPPPPAVPEAPAARDEATATNGRSDTSVRVRTDRLDRLIDLVSELVIAQAMTSQDEIVLGGAHQELTRKVAHAGKIVRELQDLSMSMRMVPLRATFQKMVRLSRDAAHRSGKEVELVLEGEDTEIDRNMVDVIGDPLVHMVRNAIDHGIEPPAARAERGKPATGRLRLAAYHAGGSVVVELEDDGQGLDRERILRKAIAKGLLESEKGMSDADVYKLIFAPGFSTNDVVTDLSGRGVGMDVVRRNIEAIQGRIEIDSEPGRGCKFTIRLPLTLATTDGMSVRVGAERYIIPTIHITTRRRRSSW